jgi:hypothetical protein
MVRSFLLPAVLVLVAGCGPKPEEKSRVSNTPLSDGYSLLFELLGKEKQVGMVLIVKNAPEDVAETIKKIAEFSAESHETLEELGKDSDIRLDRSNLPQIEVDVCGAIEKTQAGELLGGKGREFTALLLNGQVQGLDYMKHLCHVLMEIKENGEREKFLEKTGKEAWKLRGRAFEHLCNLE